MKKRLLALGLAVMLAMGTTAAVSSEDLVVKSYVDGNCAYFLVEDTPYVVTKAEVRKRIEYDGTSIVLNADGSYCYECPIPTLEPEATDTPTPKPSATPLQTLEPDVTEAPTAKPTATPLQTLEPDVTEAPTAKPTATPLQTIAPTEIPYEIAPTATCYWEKE